MRKPKVAIIGAGRVGQSLGRGLWRAGYPIGAVVTRTRSHAQRARRFIGAGRAMSRLSAAVLDAEVLLISTPDKAIAGVARELTALGGRALGGKIVLHTSGALTSNVLRPVATAGAHVGSFHPLQTFGRATAALAGVTFAIEGDRAAEAQAARLARDLGGIAAKVSRRAKVLYHAAATLACGRLLALVDGAAKTFVRSGVRAPKARRAILRLVRQTLDNFERLGGRAAWTGPLERGDLATLALHARSLGREPELRDTYRALGELALRLYRPRDRSLARAFRKLFAH